MSRGFFDHFQHRIGGVADTIEQEIENTKKTQGFGYVFPEEILAEFRNGVKALRKARFILKEGR